MYLEYTCRGNCICNKLIFFKIMILAITEKGNLTLNDESSVQQDGLMSMINANVSKSSMY